MPKKGTPAYEILHPAKKKSDSKSESKPKKKKLEEMNDSEKVEHYKKRLANANAKVKELKEQVEKLADHINNSAN